MKLRFRFKGKKLCTRAPHECLQMYYHHGMDGGHIVYFIGVFTFAHGIYAYAAGALAIGLLLGMIFKLEE